MELAEEYEPEYDYADDEKENDFSDGHSLDYADTISENRLDEVLKSGLISDYSDLLPNPRIDSTPMHVLKSDPKTVSDSNSDSGVSSDEFHQKTQDNREKKNVYDPSTIADLIKTRMKITPSSLLNLSENHVNWSEIVKLVTRNMDITKTITEMLQNTKLSIELENHTSLRPLCKYVHNEAAIEEAMFARLGDTLGFKYANVTTVVLLYLEHKTGILWNIPTDKVVQLSNIKPGNAKDVCKGLLSTMIERGWLTLDGNMNDRNNPYHVLYTNNIHILQCEKIIPNMRVILTTTEMERTKFQSTQALVAFLEGISRYQLSAPENSKKVSVMIRIFSEGQSYTNHMIVKVETHASDMFLDSIRIETTRKKRHQARALSVYECPLFHSVCVAIQDLMVHLQFCDHGKHYIYHVYRTSLTSAELDKRANEIAEKMKLHTSSDKTDALYKYLLKDYKKLITRDMNVCTPSMKTTNRELVIMTNPTIAISVQNTMPLITYMELSHKILQTKKFLINVKLNIEYHTKKDQRNKFDLKMRNLHVVLPTMSYSQTCYYRVYFQSDTITTVS